MPVLMQLREELLPILRGVRAKKVIDEEGLGSRYRAHGQLRDEFRVLTRHATPRLEEQNRVNRFIKYNYQ